MSETATKTELKSTRDAFGEAIIELAAENPNIIALTANVADPTRLGKFKEKLPLQYLEVGVAEQNMAGIAAGLALSGKIPFMTSFAAFSPGRNWDQIRVSICYNQANVKIISTHAGLSVGADGATHQALEDIALTRVIPNLVVLNPCDFNETKQALKAAAKYTGPVYIRLGREPLPIITDPEEAFQIGKSNVLKDGKDVTIIATGLMVHEAIQAADQLENEGISAEIINCSSIKPLDGEQIIKSAKKTGKVIACEEHQIIGGLGSAVAEALAEKCPTPLIRVGVHDSFGESGTCRELLSKYHCDQAAIIAAAKKLNNQN